jgi:hypothetical protein
VQLIQEIEPESNNDIADLTMGNLEINDYSQSLIEFTDKENAIMRTLPNRECRLYERSSIHTNANNRLILRLKICFLMRRAFILA